MGVFISVCVYLCVSVFICLVKLPRSSERTYLDDAKSVRAALQGEVSCMQSLVIQGLRGSNHGLQMPI